MADRRSIARAPFDAPEHRAARGPNGRKLCRWCGVEVPKGRTLWCSQRCVDEFVVRKGDGRAARIVFERDKGVCALCGLDTEVLRAATRGHDQWNELVRRGFNRCQRLWQADHVTPVVEGGGACGLDNLRTLCTPCHKAETARLAARRAEERRARRAEAAGERSLFADATSS